MGGYGETVIREPADPPGDKHPSTGRALVAMRGLPFSGDDRRPPKRVLQEIETKQRAARDSCFPETADLPDEFDDLYHAWIDMRKFVNGLADKALSGRAPSPADLSAFDVKSVHRRVREFQKAHPEVAEPYVALFK